MAEVVGSKEEMLYNREAQYKQEIRISPCPKGIILSVGDAAADSRSHTVGNRSWS